MRSFPQIVEALPDAIDMGLRLPLVYNTSAYDSLESLRVMDGLVDIYMPDFKLWGPQHSRRYLLAPDYPEVARAAFSEMHAQVGDLRVDEDGVARRGLLVRHLVMPGLLENSHQVMEFLARELSPDTCVNIMAQYRPQWEVTVDSHPEINRCPTQDEMSRVYAMAREMGLHRFA